MGLVLSRQKSETIEIHIPVSDKPQVVIVRVDSIRGDKVRLDLAGDKSIGFFRSEVANAIRRGQAEKPAPM
jgi:sRNA-binding carbon storage regulator CsrA